MRKTASPDRGARHLVTGLSERDAWDDRPGLSQTPRWGRAACQTGRRAREAPGRPRRPPATLDRTTGRTARGKFPTLLPAKRRGRRSNLFSHGAEVLSLAARWWSVPQTKPLGRHRESAA